MVEKNCPPILLPYVEIFFSFIFISWRLITLQYCSSFCHTLTWISHGFTCAPHPDPPSRLPPHPSPLGLPSAPALSTCLAYSILTHIYGTYAENFKTTCKMWALEAEFQQSIIDFPSSKSHLMFLYLGQKKKCSKGQLLLTAKISW